MSNLSVKLFGKTLDNPIIPASGTFGFGYEFNEYYDISILGSICLKGTTLEERYGNPLPRIAECPAGMLNAIGLQNPGVDKVISTELKKLKKVYPKKVIANVGGTLVEDYVETVKRFSTASSVLAIELNISCPNVKSGGMAFGTSAKSAEELTKAVVAVSTKPIIVKLSPNVTDISEIAKAVEGAGASAVSLINTLVGLRLDLKTGKPILSMNTGGYSGKGVFPVALRMVYQTYKAVKIPIIGMGGISTAEDILEMFYAGASAVMIGTENLINPYICKEIIESLPSVMEQHGISSLQSIKGKAHL
ncbi:MAG: dihydroorotate dehydrogenase [Firmicutes bacterium]|nr:dihydroorotate dehydrogenase [Bacillota bacterium]